MAYNIETPATVKTPIGEFNVRLDGDHPVVDLPPRNCRGCGMPLASPLGLAWTIVFVRECYVYCCACCDYDSQKTCPKEWKERRCGDRRKDGN